MVIYNCYIFFKKENWNTVSLREEPNRLRGTTYNWLSNVCLFTFHIEKKYI